MDIKDDTHLTASAALQKVNRLLMAEVGDRVGGEAPALVSGDTPRWRVPVYVYSAAKERLGQVGTVEVDAVSGEVHSADQLLPELARQASALISAGALARYVHGCEEHPETDEDRAWGDLCAARLAEVLYEP